MRRLGLALALAASAFLVACGGGGGGSPAPVPTPTPVTYKATDWNAAVGWWSDASNAAVTDAQLHTLVDHLKTTGYSGVTFTYGIPVDIATGHTQQNNVSITRMLALMDYAYSIGLNVNLKVCWTDPNNGNINQWGLNLNGVDYTSSWIDNSGTHAQNWSTTVMPNATTFLTDVQAYYASFAPVAQAHHVKTLILGTENDFLTFAQYASNWQSIVQVIRSGGFNGVLTYDAIYMGTTGDNFPLVAIWGSMDRIGLSFYPNFSADTNSTVASLKTAWEQPRTLASVTSSCAAINPANGPNATSINADIIAMYTQWNKTVVFTENTFQDSQAAAMNWHTVPSQIGCGIVPDPAQHAAVVQAELEEIKTNLHGIVTGFHMMGYDPWEYGQTDTSAPNYFGQWKSFDQMFNSATGTTQTAEGVLKTYMEAGL